MIKKSKDNHIYIDLLSKRMYYIYPNGSGCWPYTKKNLHQLKCEMILSYGNVPKVKSYLAVKKRHIEKINIVKNLL